ncbi:MAG: uridine monophosphate kinase [Clostridiales bacterium]|nr:uridine monophosphate kinase [Clostridiales bacterium]
MPVTYKRVILKLSGEALGENGKGFCHEKFEEAAKMLIDIQKTGVELAVVIGGGNVWRGRRGAAMRMGTVAADQMGMLGTLQNCLYMRDTLAHMGAKAVVMTAVDMPRFAEPYNTVKALDLLAQGHIVLFACGIGSPCFSTDTTVVLRGIELECDALLMAKNIDGVYTADPNVDPTATLIPDISYAEAAARDLRVMDAAAFSLLRENNVPQLRVFGLQPAENIIKVLNGDTMGTVLHP